MLQSSALFKAALRESHRVGTRATLLTPSKAKGTFTTGKQFTVVSGNLTIDGGRDVRRSASLVLTDLEPTLAKDLRSIDAQSRLRIERGIFFPDGTEEWVTLALLQVQDVTIRNGEASAEVMAQDLGSLVQDYDLITPYAPIDSAQQKLTTVAAIKDLVDIALTWDSPTWTVDPSIDQTVIPADGTVYTGSRWAAIRDLAESIGAVVSANVDGSWSITPAAPTSQTASITIDSGKDGVLVEYSDLYSRSEQYNAIPLRWGNSESGGLVFLVDTDTSSPTFWNGSFGHKPRAEESNETITTSDQAIKAATALLAQYKGRSSQLSLSAVHNPLLEPFDHIHVKTADWANTYVVDSITYPLAGGTMSCAARHIAGRAYDQSGSHYNDPIKYDQGA